MTLREKLIVLRDKAGISQMALAHQLDVSRQAVSRWESGDATPSIDKLKALAKVYGVSLDWLCSDADELDGENKQVPEIREATENNEDAQSGAVQDRRKKKKLGIAAAIVIFGILLLGCLLYRKGQAAKPMEDMSNKTIAPEESENTEPFDFGW